MVESLRTTYINITYITYINCTKLFIFIDFKADLRPIYSVVYRHDCSNRTMKGASCLVILLMFALLEAWRLKCLAVANQGKTSFPFFFSEGDNNFPEDNLLDCL